MSVQLLALGLFPNGPTPKGPYPCPKAVYDDIVAVVLARGESDPAPGAAMDSYPDIPCEPTSLLLELASLPTQASTLKARTAPRTDPGTPPQGPDVSGGRPAV